MNATVYGTRPDLLPTGIREAVRARRMAILDSDENGRIEAASIKRLGHLPGDLLDWRDVPLADNVTYESESDAVAALSTILAKRAGPESELVVLWGSLAVPSVRMPARMAFSHLAELVEWGPQFWIVLPAEGYLLECLPDGQITGAYLPGGAPPMPDPPRTTQ